MTVDEMTPELIEWGIKRCPECGRWYPPDYDYWFVPPQRLGSKRQRGHCHRCEDAEDERARIAHEQWMEAHR